ncbi:L-lysine 6-monooxygenase family protein [Madurella fahalii]|uniref:L-lysine 6-monooxygenase family protein n=1 Tax=Madurella fahalii TaxID=1157608 RepID=A0ABQ0GKF7_9PEZI
MVEHIPSHNTSHHRLMHSGNPEIHDVIIVGAGPCGLAVAARLREHAPAAIFTDEEHRRYQWLRRYGNAVTLKHVKSGRVSRCVQAGALPELDVVVLDATHDKWLGRWNKLFASYDISHLRSPMFWHVDPKDRDSLLAHAYECHRGDELLEIRKCVGKEISKHMRKKRLGRGEVQHSQVEVNERERNDYFNPSQSLFTDHCHAVINRYGLADGMVKKESVQDIRFEVTSGVSSDGDRLFTVVTDQTRRYARAVVLAVGPANEATIPRLPSMASDFSPVKRLPNACHSAQIEQFPDPAIQEKISRGLETNILVVGGGLTSAQLSDLAIRRGVTKVWHIMRGPCRVKPFDVDLKWMSKYRNVEQAYFWSANSDEERLQMLRAARGGGSMTPVFHRKLKEHSTRGRLALHTSTTLVDAKFEEAEGHEPRSGMWVVKTDPPIDNLPRLDYIYFATGVETNISSLPYLQTMRETHPIPELGGFPCLNGQLMWKDGVPLFIAGRLAALSLGPAAPNLGGAKMGAERIALALQEIISREEITRSDGDYASKNENKWFGYISGQGNKYGCLAQNGGAFVSTS